MVRIDGAAKMSLAGTLIGNDADSRALEVA
jgi:hypothetical protein